MHTILNQLSIYLWMTQGLKTLFCFVYFMCFTISYFELLDSYTQRIRVSSEKFRNQLNTPLETAKHWVIHVAKHKGAPHLKTIAVDLPFYALYNLDVWAFVVLIEVLIVLILKFLFQKVSTILCLGSEMKTKTA